MDASEALQRAKDAVASGKIEASSLENMQRWLESPDFEPYRSLLIKHIAEGKWETLDRVFYKVAPFGTGGRRGEMYPIGTNAINERTIGESAQGLADYVRSVKPGETKLACAIAYDTRHRSRDFAELCAEVMVAAGFTVYFLDGYRSTPALSFAVRHKNCDCGIMVTASHNPPEDNAVKVYWSNGGQLLAPHGEGVVEAVDRVAGIERASFKEAVASGKVQFCQEEIDRQMLAAQLAQRFEGPRELKILYSPLHGVGSSAVLPLLEEDRFTDIHVFPPHAEPDGSFPNVPGNQANPENVQLFDDLIAYARQIGADVVLATDPDCDRLGVAAPLSARPGSAWKPLTGNQVGALLTDFVLERRKSRGAVPPDSYVVKTMVTTEMIRRIADGYGVRTIGNLHVGFKFIGGVMDEAGPDRFLIGAEESLGYLVGSYARDKDGAVAAMLVAELAARLKQAGQTLHEKLDALFWQFGCHVERVDSTKMPGAEGEAHRNRIMQSLRGDPPTELAGLPVAQVRDYQNLTTLIAPGGKRRTEPLDAPAADMVMVELEGPGTYVAVRPSGTEPKIKFYLFDFEPAEQIADLEDTKQQLSERLENIHKSLVQYVEQRLPA